LLEVAATFAPASTGAQSGSVTRATGAPPSLSWEPVMIFIATLLQLLRWAEPFDLEVD
jgi:hypothetical protein